MPTRSCDVCGEAYEHRRATSRFCSERCRKRHRRSVVTALPTNPMPLSIHSATLRELTEVGRETSALGAVALHLARLLDDPPPSVTGSQIAALSRELRATHAAAMTGATRTSARDPLAELRARRDAIRRGTPPA